MTQILNYLLSPIGATAHREHVLANFCNELEGLMELSWDEVRGYYNELNLLNGRVVRVYHKARGVCG